MSKDVHKNQVFQTTRVRISLKNDGSWIQKSKQQDEEEDNARTDRAVETTAIPTMQKSYVLSAAKRFESVDSPLSPPLQTPRFIPPEGDSANKENSEVIAPQKDAQPEGSTVETADYTKPPATKEERIQSYEAQPEKSVAKTTAENVAVEEHADTAINQSNVQHNKGAAEISVDVHAEESTQNGEAKPLFSTKDNPEAVSPVELAEQPVANTRAENKAEYADKAVESIVEHSEAKVSADARVEDPLAEISAAAVTEESQNAAKVPAVISVELRPQEEASSQTDPANAKNVAVVEPTVQPAEGSSVEQAAEEIVQAVAEVVVKSSPDKSDVIYATPAGEAALQGNLEPVPGLLADSVSESPTQPAAETVTEGSCEKGPTEQAAEAVTAVAEVAVESSPKPPAVTDAAGEEAALQDCVEPVPDLVADTVTTSPTQPAAETAAKSVECKAESAASAEPVLKTRAEETVECEVQPVENTVVKQSVDPTSESAADRVMELNIEDAVEPIAVQDKLAYGAIELTDALDVEPPTAVAAPEPLKDPKQSHAEETKLKLNQQSDDTATYDSEMFQKPAGERQSTQTLNKTRYRKAVCSFCSKIIDGDTKITFSEPLVICHPDCLKCGVCAKALGDMRTPMFLHNKVIQCDGCFKKALNS